MKIRCQFEIITVTDTYILIDDQDIGRSVTNDAEAVVEFFAPQLNSRRLFYIDTQGDYTELIVRDGKFYDFAPVKDWTKQWMVINE